MDQIMTNTLRFRKLLPAILLVATLFLAFPSFYIPPAQAVIGAEDIVWESGFEDGDSNFPSWDAWYSDTGSSTTTISTEQVRDTRSKSVKFTMASGYKSDKARRLGLFVHDDTETVYERGFYYSFWMFIPSNIEDMIDKSYNWLTIGGLKWYFYKYLWSFGARWALQWNNGKIMVRLHIGGHMNSGYGSPQEGVHYDPPESAIWWSNINYGAWNHFQIYLKSKTDATGAWQAWVNDISLGSLTNVRSHPNAFLTPTQGTDFFTQHNLCPHPQVMYYVDKNAPGGTLYADDVVIATEKVTEDYMVDYPTVSEYVSFYNGFEEGDFSAWNGPKVNDPSEAWVSITSSVVFSGSYAMNVTTDGSDDSFGRVKKQFQRVNEVYARTYIRFPELPDTNNTRLMVLNIQKEGGTYIAGAGVYRFSDNYYWSIHVSGDSANPPSNYTLATINTNTWYGLELYFNATSDGNAILWVNDVLKCEVTGDFNSYAPIAEVLSYLYIDGAQASSKTVFHDNFEVDTEKMRACALTIRVEISSWTSPSWKKPILFSAGQLGHFVTVTTDSNGQATLIIIARGSKGIATIMASADGLPSGDTVMYVTN